MTYKHAVTCFFSRGKLLSTQTSLRLFKDSFKPGTRSNNFKMDVWWFPTISYVKNWNHPIEPTTNKWMAMRFQQLDPYRFHGWFKTLLPISLPRLTCFFFRQTNMKRWAQKSPVFGLKMVQYLHQKKGVKQPQWNPFIYFWPFIGGLCIYNSSPPWMLQSFFLQRNIWKNASVRPTASLYTTWKSQCSWSWNFNFPFGGKFRPTFQGW